MVVKDPVLLSHLALREHNYFKSRYACRTQYFQPLGHDSAKVCQLPCRCIVTLKDCVTLLTWYTFFSRQVEEVTFYFNLRGGILTYALTEAKMFLFSQHRIMFYRRFIRYALNYDAILRQRTFLVHLIVTEDVVCLPKN